MACFWLILDHCNAATSFENILHQLSFPFSLSSPFLVLLLPTNHHPPIISDRKLQINKDCLLPFTKCWWSTCDSLWDHFVIHHLQELCNDVYLQSRSSKCPPLATLGWTTSSKLWVQTYSAIVIQKSFCLVPQVVAPCSRVRDSPPRCSLCPYIA